MADRYQRIYTLPDLLHLSDAPVLIAGGVLLRDSHSDLPLVQLRLQSITDKPISAAAIEIVGLDSIGKEICRSEIRYEGLHIARDENFGAKEALELSRDYITSFRPERAEIVFEDGETWSGRGEWLPLPTQDSLNQRLFDTEIVRQYKLETTDQSRFVPIAAGDLWLCACGAVNHRGEVCHCCGQTLEHCTELMNIELLRSNKSLRLNAEAMKASIEEARRRSRSTIVRRLLLVLVPLLLIAGAAVGYHFYRARLSERYDRAVALYNLGDYTGAVQLFDSLRGYRDSADYSRQAKQIDAQAASYARACKLFENGRWDDARDAFEQLGDYEESSRLALESLYCKGRELIDEGQFEKAREIFLSLGDYSDSPTVVAHFFDRLVSEQVSFNSECGGPLTTTYRYDSQGRLAETTEHFSEYAGMSDRVSLYSYGEDGSKSVLQNQVEKHYDAQGNLLGQGSSVSYAYDYAFYDDGTVHYCIQYDADSHMQISAIAYDTHGNPETFLTADGSTRSIRNEYEGDRLIKQESYDESGAMLTRKTFEYDDLGRLKRTSALSPGAASAVTESFSYGIVYVPENNE